MFDHIQAYHRPQSVREAVSLLHQESEGRFVAGGTGVVVEADRSIRFLVDITGIGLSYIRQEEDRWLIGATTTLAGIERSLEMQAMAGGVLAKAASTCGTVQNRNMATIGGNVASGSPASEMATALLALDAAATLVDPQGPRNVPLASLFAEPRGAALRKALLAEIAIPVAASGGRAGWSFQKLGRTRIDISLVNVAAGLELEADGRVKRARIALGAVAPTPMRAQEAEKLLAGRKLDRKVIGDAAAQAAREARPITDARASAEFRRRISGVLTERSLLECASRAGCQL